MSSPVYSAPLQPYHVRNLINILRDANAHYTRVAERIRVSYVPTHHARNRARKLGLEVNVAKAVACDHRHVSTIPLPIVEQSPLPASYIVSSTSCQQQTHLSPLVPAQLTKTTPNGTTSAFSSASVYSFVTLTSAAISALEDDMSMDVEEDQYEDEVQHPPMPVDMPLDAALIEWSIYDEALSEGISMKIEDASMFDFDESPLSSPSTTDSSSTGPATPDDQVYEPVVLRIKRKSAEMTGYSLDEYQKQTKMLKGDDGWNSESDNHRNVIRIPARRV